jgi:Flp pilus assembly protein TadG
MKPSTQRLRSNRRGLVAVLTAILLVVILGMVAFAVDIGYGTLAKTELQAAADAAALAAAGSSNLPKADVVRVAQGFAHYHQVAGRSVLLNPDDVQFGVWDISTRTFAPSNDVSTAVKVTVRADAANGGNVSLFFGSILGVNSLTEKASAVAVVNPRDIAFVVDLSGSMNFDTTPDSSSATTSLIQAVYNDFGFGAYPGTLQTRQSGKTTQQLMTGQLATVMPNAVPAPDVNSAESVAYWSAYFNYIGAGGQIGYKTYVKFMMSHGRDQAIVPEVKDAGGNITQNKQYTILSINNPNYRKHSESTDGGTFTFPTPEMPTHACRRAIIAALKVIQDRNATVNDASQKDRVSIIVFDAKNNASDTTHVQILKALTDNYPDVMSACSTLQACNSSASCTDTEGGLITAYNHIKPASEGGMGRENTNKVVVLLTDGIPNLYESSNTTINAAMAANPGGWGSNYAENGALMQAMNLASANWYIYPVGVGRGGDQTFMNQVAVKSGTAKNGAGYTIASDASAYENTLRSIFQGIITNPKLRLVQ